MSLPARALGMLHVLCAVLLVGAVAIGYLADGSAGLTTLHNTGGFFLALLAGFTHAMTLFWFAGIGVSMREATAGSARGGDLLARAAASRRRVAPGLGFALVAIMAAVILGGGSHTGALPRWPHHVAGLAAVLFQAAFTVLVVGEIRRYEEIALAVEAATGARTP